MMMQKVTLDICQRANRADWYGIYIWKGKLRKQHHQYDQITNMTQVSRNTQGEAYITFEIVI